MRLAWDGALDPITRAGRVRFVASLFTAVVLGVLDEAIAAAHASRSRKKADQLRAYEQVEWSRAELRALARGAGVRGRAAGRRSGRSADRVALPPCAPRRRWPSSPRQRSLRLTRVLGGGTFSQRSPFAHWFEDVRALGFLRPPWGLAYDTLFATSIEG